MKNTKLDFDFIFCDMDNGSINFIHTGKVDLFTRLSYNCITTEKNFQYAFRPRTPEEFLEFLKKTKMFETEDGSDIDFVIATLSPKTGQNYKTAFEFFIHHVARNFHLDKESYDALVNDANKLRDRMLYVIRRYREIYENPNQDSPEQENE